MTLVKRIQASEAKKILALDGGRIRGMMTIDVSFVGDIDE